MKKLLSVIAAAALAMTSFAAFATTASAKSGSAEQVICDITFSANGNTRTVENVTLPHTFSCDYNWENGELDNIIRGLYGWNSGFGENQSVSVSGSTSVVGGLNGDNQYITINGAFDGTVTASSKYNVWYQYYDEDDGSWYNDYNTFPYTLTITCSAPKTVLLSADCESAEDFTSNTDTDNKASLWKLNVTPGTTAVTSVGVKVKDSNGVWHGTEDKYETPAISKGTVVFGLVVNHTSDEVYGITAVVNGNDLVMDFAD